MEEDIRKNLRNKDHKKVVELIYQLDLLGYEVKVNIYKNHKKEIRILAE